MSDKKPTIEDFTLLLRQTVEAKRLSGAKVQEVVQTGVKFLKDDIALLHAIHKTHKSLPARSQGKISSLYALDSLARGVHKLYRNASRDKDKDGGKTAGYAKGFLGKVEGVLEGWARDMCDWPEGREKMIKILDIWTKSQTFSPAALARVQAIVDSTGTTGNVSQAGSGQGSTTPVGSPKVGSTSSGTAGPDAADLGRAGSTGVGTGTGTGAGAGVGVNGNATGQETPPIMPDFLSFLSNQIQNVGTAKPGSPAQINSIGSPSASVAAVPNLTSLNGVLPPQNASVGQGSSNLVQTPTYASPVLHPQGDQASRATPNPMVPFTIAAPPAPFVPPAQDHLSAAMAKRDEIAKRFAMMGQAPTTVPSIPPPMGPPAGPPSMPHVGSPAGQYNAGPSRGQSYLDRDNRDLGGESHPSRAGGAWNSPPQPGRFDRNAPASTSGWRPQARGRSRSPSRAASRPEPARSGRAPLPGAGQPGKDEFGRDLGSRRSQSPQRDRAAYDRSRSEVERDVTVKPVEITKPNKAKTKLEDLDITKLNPAEAATWEVLGEAWINTHGRPPEGPDVMMWFMNATAEKMSSAAGMNGNAMMGTMPMMSNSNPMTNMMNQDNSHQQARLDWNDDGPYSGGGGGGDGGQRGGGHGGGSGGRGNW